MSALDSWATKTSKKIHPLQAENQLPDDHMHTEKVMWLAYCMVETL
jgi:hypothetical protein